MVSWGGRGSSSPSPIISHVKLGSMLFMLMGMLFVKLKSANPSPWGDSPLKRQASRSPAMPIEGLATLKLAGAVVWWFRDGSNVRMGVLVASGLVLLLGSWVFRSSSTCSAWALKISILTIAASRLKKESLSLT